MHTGFKVAGVVDSGDSTNELVVKSDTHEEVGHPSIMAVKDFV